MITTFIAFITDCILGDPQTKYHPVALLGRFIGAADKFFYKPGKSPAYYLIAGAGIAVAVTALTFALMRSMVMLLHMTLPLYGVYIVKGVILAFLICPRSLAAAALAVRREIVNGNLAEARKKVGYIVGRDTENLDVSEICRAVVETVAENTTDGIVSPLFFYALGGLPLAAVYKAVNTLDSIMGYKNGRYFYYGRFAARLDDVCNFIPARITAILLVGAAFLRHFDYRNAVRIIRRDAHKHPSPNGGWAEAAAAGALGVRLGGYNSYFGKMSFRAYMGDPLLYLTEKTILRAVQLMYTASIGAVIVAALCRYWE